MIFLELVLENFGPYRGRQVVNLEPQNDDNPQPIILLGGSSCSANSLTCSPSNKNKLEIPRG
ncbi:MAG: hypothetical protein AAFQ91_25195, partial [Cyanobacteria bacterium J06621_15]